MHVCGYASHGPRACGHQYRSRPTMALGQMSSISAGRCDRNASPFGIASLPHLEGARHNHGGEVVADVGHRASTTQPADPFVVRTTRRKTLEFSIVQARKSPGLEVQAQGGGYRSGLYMRPICSATQSPWAMMAGRALVMSRRIMPPWRAALEAWPAGGSLSRRPWRP